MKAQELRIGNFLSDKVSGTLLKVDYISKESFGVYVLDRSKYPLPEGWEAEPIPITEQWLIYFGFKRGVDFWFNGDVILDISPEGLSYRFHYNIILHLHQLQNLYFVLTGKELTKK